MQFLKESYELKLIDRAEAASTAYRQLQTFGQVPVVNDGPVTLFESGAIILHLSEKSDVLMPKEPAGRGRVTAWIFAALNSVEPFVQRYNTLTQEDSTEESLKKQRSNLLEILEKRFDSLNIWLKGKEYLENHFTAGDIMMATVLRNLDNKNILAKYPDLHNYFRRCEARPAFKKAIADQMKTFSENEPQA